MIKEARRPDGDKTEELVALRKRIPDMKVLTVMSRDDLGQAVRPDAASNTLVRPFDTQQLLQAIKRELQDV
jgi:DNA-binding NtrC family response regulator